MINQMGATGFYECNRCNDRIRSGQLYDRKRNQYWHTTCPVVVAVPVAEVVVPAPVAAPISPALRAYVLGHLELAGLTSVPDTSSFRRWEQEYEEE